MTHIQATTIVRQRGQLTIPDSIRKIREWASASSVVTISTQKPDEIIIKPYAPNKTDVYWKKIWKAIETARSIKGKNKGSLSEFIAQDRLNH